MHSKITLKIALGIAVTATLWASAFVFIRIGLKGFHPGSLALFRYLIASGGMFFLYIFSTKRSRVALKDIIPLLLTGIVGIGIYNITLNYGELTVTSGISGFIVSLIPVGVMLLAVLFLKEKVSTQGWVGMGVCVLGIILISVAHTSGQEVMDQGVIFLLIAAFSGAIYSVLSRSLAVKYRPIELTSFIIWGGTLVMLIYLPQLKKDLATASLEATLAGVYLGIFPAIVAYAAWSYVLRQIPASKASSFLFSLPLIATLLGWLLLGEVPDLLALVGGVIALTGAFIANKGKLLTNKKVSSVSTYEDSSGKNPSVGFKNCSAHDKK